MRRVSHIILLASVLALPLAGCGSVTDFDPTEWFAGATDLFNTKKKLPGDRKPVFPEGVPGVSQGIPSDLVKGNQPPPLENGYTATDTTSANPPPRQASGKSAPKTAPKTAARTDAANTDAGKPEEFEPAPREKPKAKPKPKP